MDEIVLFFKKKLKKKSCTSILKKMNYDRIICELCKTGDWEDVLMLCDGCDKGYHTFCANELMVPAEEWYCGKCKKNNRDKFGRFYPGLRVYLYERISSSSQDNKKLGHSGIETQNNVLLKFAEKNGLIINQTVREIKSGKNMNKLHNLKELIENIDSGECILIYSISRLGRNLRQLKATIKLVHEKRAWIYSVSDKISSLDEKFEELLKISEYEYKIKSKNIIDAHKRIKQLGGHIGPTPFGYRSFYENGIRKLTENPEERKIIDALLKIYNANKNVKKTAALLNKKKLFKRNAAWTPNQVIRFVQQ